MYTTSASLVFTVKRGLGIGTKLTPHKYKDGSYVASLTRFKRDYIRVNKIEQLCELAHKGYKVRMSSPSHARGPSLVFPEFV